jgi:hypothetical protein
MSSSSESAPISGIPELKKSKRAKEKTDDSIPVNPPSPTTPTKSKKKKTKVMTQSTSGEEGEVVIEDTKQGKSEKLVTEPSPSSSSINNSEKNDIIGEVIVKSKSKTKVRESGSGKSEKDKSKKMDRSGSDNSLEAANIGDGEFVDVSKIVSVHEDVTEKVVTAEDVRSNLMSPLTRIRQTAGRSRSGSSPARRESAAQIRAQVHADTEKLAKAGNATAKRILHRAKSESEVSMNSWDLGSTAGLRSSFTTNDQLLARAHAAATRRSKAHQLTTRPSVLLLPDTFSPSISKDIIAEQLLAPMRSRPEGDHHNGKHGSSRKNQTLRSPANSIPSPTSPPQNLSEDIPVAATSSTSSSSLGSDDGSSSPITTPRSPRTGSKRSLASFGRKTSYHSLGRTSSGMLPSMLSPAGSPRSVSGSTNGSSGGDTGSSAGDKAKSHMEVFLRFVSSHLSNPQLAEGIALMHSILVPSTFLFDHVQTLFKGDNHDYDILGDLEPLRKDVINFVGTWVTFAPTDFVDDFVLEKKLKDWIASLREMHDQTHISFSLLLQTIVNQSIQSREALKDRVLSEAEILDMAEASRKGLVPGDVISLIVPSVTVTSASNVPDELVSVRSKPKAIPLSEANRKESNKSLARSPSFDSVASASSRSSTPSPPPFVEPSFENMVDLARRVSSREMRSGVSASQLSPSSSSSNATAAAAGGGTPSSISTSPSKSKISDSSRKDSSSKSKTKDEIPPSSSSNSSNPNVASSSTSNSSSSSSSSSSTSLTSSHGVVAPDDDELAHKPKFGKKLLLHLSEQIGLKEAPLLLNINVVELAKQWTLLDHATLCKVRAHDMLLNVSKPSRSPTLTDIANKFNHATCWVAVQILKIPNVKKRALAVAHMIALAETLLNLTNLHGFIAIITGLSQHAISRLNMTWKKVDPAAKRTFDALVNLASPIGNFKQLRSIHDNALPPFVPTPAMFLRDLLFVIEGNGGSFVQASVVKTDMILLCRKVLSRIQSAQQVNYKFWGVEPIQTFMSTGNCLTNEELDALSEKVESGRDM